MSSGLGFSQALTHPTTEYASNAWRSLGLTSSALGVAARHGVLGLKGPSLVPLVLPTPPEGSRTEPTPSAEGVMGRDPDPDPIPIPIPPRDGGAEAVRDAAREPGRVAAELASRVTEALRLGFKDRRVRDLKVYGLRV